MITNSFYCISCRNYTNPAIESCNTQLKTLWCLFSHRHYPHIDFDLL